MIMTRACSGTSGGEIEQPDGGFAEIFDAGGPLFVLGRFGTFEDLDFGTEVGLGLDEGLDLNAVESLDKNYNNFVGLPQELENIAGDAHVV